MKVKTHYSCQNCGQNCAKWLGRCPACGEWNSLVEEKNEPAASDYRVMVQKKKPGESAYVALEEVVTDENSNDKAARRIPTGSSELDRVLGGGLVRDSFVLLGGDPGIGKSTLLLQMARGMAALPNQKILYVSGEESVEQLRSRAERLQVEGNGKIFLASETELEQAIASVKELKPTVLIMDSLQTFASRQLESAPGSVSQVREVAVRLMGLAKSEGLAIWIVGHVTKEGNIAGPKVVEHMVDTVLYFEGEGGQNYRLLRTVKNRFGRTHELGVFQMEGEGLIEVSNPSQLFLSDRKEAVSGTATASSLEGTRPLLVEVQALVSHSTLAMPRRTSVGIDNARISLLAAIIEKHMKISLSQNDLYFNVAGGLRLSEPAADLAALAAIASSAMSIAVPQNTVWIGEAGLTGEVRRVSQLEIRIEEAQKLGFKSIILPRASSEKIKVPDGIQLHRIDKVAEIPGILRRFAELGS